MKLKLTLILLFVSLGIYAQKQIQSYSYTLRDSTNIPRTIYIYANAEAVNKVTFTLKNAKNETFKDNDNEDVTFEVFPFGEVIFREKFVDAIKGITLTGSEDEDEEKTIEVFKKFVGGFINKTGSNKTEKFNKQRGDAINNFRNVYQFFNALIITAFQYDTEPVAGLLKYNDEVTVTKKNIEGLDTEDYFKRQAKFIREIIVKAEGNFDNIKLKHNQKKYENIKVDCFIEFLSFDKSNLQIFNCYGIIDDKTKPNSNSYLKEFFEFHQNSRKRKRHNAKVVLKKYLIKRLKELYNKYEFTTFLNREFVHNYFNYKSQEDDLNTKINDIVLKNTNLKNSEKEIDEKISYIEDRSLGLKTDLINKFIDISRFQEDSLFNAERKKTLNESKKNLESNLSVNNTKIDTLKKQLNNIRNETNFLIVDHKDQIAKVPLWRLKIDNIEIDLNDGFLEHISVTGKITSPFIDKSSILAAVSKEDREKYSHVKIDDYISSFYNEPYVKDILKNILEKELKFENEFPIGFSSKTDFADMDNYNLYAFEGSEKVFSLGLTDVIHLYIQRHQNDRLNFSPKDQVIRLPLDDVDKNKEVELKKETSSKILNANIFTDFNGFKESEPNGLVQVEIEKWVPIWTKRMDLGLGRSSNFGLFNYANFNLTWAKVNEEDREVQVKYAGEYINNELQVDKFVTYLDLVKYENISVGVDLNLASFDFPLLKTRLELNAGGHYGRLKIVDKITNEDGNSTTEILKENVNIIRFYPDAILRIRPDERFGGYLRYRPFKLIVPNNEEFYAVSSAKDFEENRELNKSWLHRYELGAFFAPSVKSDNKFFFRYRYTNTSTWETNGYSEIQVGYLMYLRL